MNWFGIDKYMVGRVLCQCQAVWVERSVTPTSCSKCLGCVSEPPGVVTRRGQGIHPEIHGGYSEKYRKDRPLKSNI